MSLLQKPIIDLYKPSFAENGTNMSDLKIKEAKF